MPAKSMKHSWQLENSYAELPSTFYSFQHPAKVVNPQLVCFNEGLKNELGLEFLNEGKDQLAAFFSGNKVPDLAKPLAQAYAGHQFGHFTMLGDGRAILLGEHLDSSGGRFDVQLKGAGQTPYSRRGDGRATLYSMLREYLISEAMHHLGVSTTRSLAVVATGEQVFRGEMHDGAVLTRTAKSHIRVGTFEYARHFGNGEDLTSLANYTIGRHFPQLADSEKPALELLQVVMEQQIALIVDWMRVGFIHGVMNTDNMSIAGETIDYGPCAFMNTYHPETVFSSIDQNGRYAFGNQPGIAHWNLTVFANSLLPLISEDQKEAVALAQDVLDRFQQNFSKSWYAMMFDKLGVLHPQERDKTLVDELLVLMEATQMDYTQVFLALPLDQKPDQPFFHSEEFKNWFQKWLQVTARNEGQEARLSIMSQSNPRVIPRNHWVENALNAAVEGDMGPFNQLLKTLSQPYNQHPTELQFQQVPADFDKQYQTFCGT
ncbi:MAG: YdiU family protein [Bacteroidota bacterium]